MTGIRPSLIAASRRRVLDPLTLSPAMWLDANDSSRLFDAVSGGSLVAANGVIRRWEDKSGNANHATRINDSFLPTRRVAVQNGKDIVRFESNDFRAGMATPLDYRIDNVDIYIVYARTGRPTNSFDGTNFLIGGNTLNGGGGRWNINAGNSVLQNVGAQCRSNSASQGLTISASDNGTDFRLVRLRGSATTLAGAKNNASLTSAALTLTPATTAGLFRIANGLSLDTSSNFAFIGDICEIFIFSSHLSSGDETRLLDYTNNKWNLWTP
jgi:hypothetical protein